VHSVPGFFGGFSVVVGGALWKEVAVKGTFHEVDAVRYVVASKFGFVDL